MGILQTLDVGQGYLKAGFLGFPKSGKTYTATRLAIGTRAFFGLKGPIGFYDTEGGVEYVRKMIQAETGLPPVGLKSRSLADLIAVGKECESSGVSVLIADSMTHVWREVCASALTEINDQRTNGKWRKPALKKLEFQHWGPIKAKWAEWTDFYLNSRLHIVICGRAGFDYDYQDVQGDGGKKELVKTGVKMQTEKEFGFEPSLLVEMERTHGPQGQLVHHATILGDRFSVIDAAECDNPTFEFFAPHVRELTSGAMAAIDTTARTEIGLDEDGDGEWSRERRQRAIYAEEIQGLLTKHIPGQTAAEKARKLTLLEDTFKTRSWTKISESTGSDVLREGLARMRSELEGDGPPTAEEERASLAKEDFEIVGEGGAAA